MAAGGPPGSPAAGELEATLTATLQVVAAQRAQLDELRAALAQAEDRAAELGLELAGEREAREAAEAGLRNASVDFARRLSAMQARVLDAERDVLLGGQVLV